MDYRYLASAKGRVLLSADDAVLNGALKKKAFKSPEEICSYDFKLEEGVLKLQPERPASHAISVNGDILKSLNELKDEIESISNTSTRGDGKNDDNVSYISGENSRNNTLALRMKAERAAEEYFPPENNPDAASVLKYIDFYCTLQEYYAQPTVGKLEDPPCLLDDEIGMCFDLDILEASRAMMFVATRRELKDLGFDNESVISALLMFNNDRDLCIDYLMRN